MSTELARRDQDAFELGTVFAESGMFPNVRKQAEAVVKILAGREFGLGPMAAMNGIHMVDGKPTLAANLIAGQIKRHPTYDYRVIRREANGCEIEFFDRETSLGSMTWDETDAKAAGLLGKKNWRSYPRDMYFARCLTAGARTFCPDVLGGSPIYTAEELGAEDFATPEGVGAPATEPDPAEAEVMDAVEVKGNGGAAQTTEPASTIQDEADGSAPSPNPESRVTGGHVDKLRTLATTKEKSADWIMWALVEVDATLDDSIEDVGDRIRVAIEGLRLEQAILLAESMGGSAEDLA